MGKLLHDWYSRHFSDPQVALLTFLLILGFSIIIFAGQLLTPLLAAIIIAYLLDGGVTFLQSHRCPRFLAVISVFSVFILLLLITLFVLAPLMLRQASAFVLEIPKMLSQGQTALMALPEQYPHLINTQTIQEFLLGIRSQVSEYSQQVLSFSLASVVDLLSFMVYLVVVPLLVFFFLKDKSWILIWLQSYLPKDRQLVNRVWVEVNCKIVGYVRGKFLEILIAWGVSYITFLFLGLNYAMLLSFIF
jgi:putative permease